MEEVIALMGRCSEGEWGLKNGDGSPSGGILLLPQNPEEVHKVGASPLPVEARLRLGAPCSCLCKYDVGRVEQGSKHKPDEGSGCGCLGAGGGPRSMWLGHPL